jgi:hypothetical protein
MAAIPALFSTSVAGVPRLIWTGITTTSDTADSFIVIGQSGVAGSVQFAGTFAGGSTAVLQCSNDGSTWFTMKDTLGNNISATAAAYFEFTTTAAYIRPAVTSGSADNVDVIVLLRGPSNSD